MVHMLRNAEIFIAPCFTWVPCHMISNGYEIVEVLRTKECRAPKTGVVTTFALKACS